MLEIEHKTGLTKIQLELLQSTGACSVAIKARVSDRLQKAEVTLSFKLPLRLYAVQDPSILELHSVSTTYPADAALPRHGNLR